LKKRGTARQLAEDVGRNLFRVGSVARQSRQHAHHSRVVLPEQGVEPRAGTAVRAGIGAGRLQRDFFGGLHTFNTMAGPDL
jgi:hypothetical protein